MSDTVKQVYLDAIKAQTDRFITEVEGFKRGYLQGLSDAVRTYESVLVQDEANQKSPA